LHYRKLGLIFNEGNTNYDTFLTEHECNQFCKQLPTVKKLAKNKSQLFFDSSDDDLPQTPFIDLTRKSTRSDDGGTAAMEISASGYIPAPE
jgi:hypothetical protein